MRLSSFFIEFEVVGMSIVKWSTVRIKTKDKLIITGQIEEMIMSGSMNNIDIFDPEHRLCSIVTG